LQLSAQNTENTKFNYFIGGPKRKFVIQTALKLR